MYIINKRKKIVTVAPLLSIEIKSLVKRVPDGDLYTVPKSCFYESCRKFSLLQLSHLNMPFIFNINGLKVEKTAPLSEFRSLFAYNYQ